MKAEKEIENIFLVVIAIISLAILIYFIGGSYTGLSIYEQDLLFNNNSDYSYENINFSDSEIKLLAYSTVENITIEDNSLFYIESAKYDKEDVEELIQYYDDNYLVMDKNNKLRLELDDKKFLNDQILVLHTLNGSIGNIFLCESSGVCNFNGTNYIGGVYYNGDDNIYNITIMGLSEEKHYVYLSTNNLTLDYVYLIEKNTTASYLEKSIYPENGYIETNEININELKNFNYFDADFLSNDQLIEFYYFDNNWSNLNIGNFSFNNDTKLKIIFKSNTTQTPILYNLTLSYEINCYENWLCSNWTECINGTKARICNDTSSCGTTLEKPSETEFCNETIPYNPPASSGGGGGGSSSGGGRKITPETTRVLEQAEQTPLETKNKEIRTLEKKIDLCENGIKDSGETKIDCGGSCKKCNSILAILPYTNYIIFILLLAGIITLLYKTQLYFKR